MLKIGMCFQPVLENTCDVTACFVIVLMFRSGSEVGRSLETPRFLAEGPSLERGLCAWQRLRKAPNKRDKVPKVQSKNGT